MNWRDLYLIEKVKSNQQAFGEKVIRISNEMGINPNWLMSLMHFETAGTMRADITNSLGYTGLIQFGKSAAEALNTTTGALRKMSNVKQLDYVKNYFVKLWKTRLESVRNITDLYLIIIFPVAVGKPDDWIIQHSSVSKYSFWKNNPAFRRGSKQYVTVGDIKSEIYRRYPRFKNETPTKPNAKKGKIAYYVDGQPVYEADIKSDDDNFRPVDVKEVTVTAPPIKKKTPKANNWLWIAILILLLSQNKKKATKQ